MTHNHCSSTPNCAAISYEEDSNACFKSTAEQCSGSTDSVEHKSSFTIYRIGENLNSFLQFTQSIFCFRFIIIRIV